MRFIKPSVFVSNSLLFVDELPLVLNEASLSGLLFIWLNVFLQPSPLLQSVSMIACTGSYTLAVPTPPGVTALFLAP
ncbi:hypothetical protein FGO68_gene9233 [Halteria grandinella]|uniref:Uncharacterized protein n=1 Tax=Halteria grandinella TaxID=5974 RepID=A0A8J8NCD9_HALGN|nr:hypothetical protein FGO68_gene9233 [Halteria grandinella]